MPPYDINYNILFGTKGIKHYKLCKKELDVGDYHAKLPKSDEQVDMYW